MITGIIIAAAVVGILGILIGVFLGVASEKFKVETDEKEILVRNELPGNNCGGCGYAGCDALAKAIAAGEAAVDGVILEHIGHVLGSDQVVDAHHFHVLVVQAGAEHHAADAAKAIDANFNAHVE